MAPLLGRVGKIGEVGDRRLIMALIVYGVTLVKES